MLVVVNLNELSTRNVFSLNRLEAKVNIFQFKKEKLDILVKDINFFEIVKCLPLPLGDLRKIYFTCNIVTKKNIFYI